MGEAEPFAVSARMDIETAAVLANTLHALGAPSRVLILDRLRAGAVCVGELSNSMGMEQSAVSHQLRIVRESGLITGERCGKHVRYLLHDVVAALLEHAFSHARQLRLSPPEPDSA